MSFRILTCLIFSVAVMMQGCAVRSVYIPISQNVPLFDSSRQVKTNAYIGANHIELQAAHNPVKHLAVSGNINFGAGIAVYDLAIGTYGFSRNAKWRYELFSGYGHNSNIAYQHNAISLFNNRNINYEVNSLYHKFYIQPCIGFFSNIPFYNIKYSFSLSCRSSFNHFKRFIYREIESQQGANGGVQIYIVNRYKENGRIFLFEPCITNKVGIRNISAVLQVQSITPYSDEIDLRYTQFSPGILVSAGIQYDFTFRKR